MTKTDLVKQHLDEHGSITSWEAIELYRATRLADIVYRLNNKGYNIECERINTYDSLGKYTGHYGKYWVRP